VFISYYGCLFASRNEMITIPMLSFGGSQYIAIEFFHLLSCFESQHIAVLHYIDKIMRWAKCWDHLQLLHKTCCAHIFSILFIAYQGHTDLSFCHNIGPQYSFSLHGKEIRAQKTTVARQLWWMHKIFFMSTEPYFIYVGICILYNHTNHQHSISTINLPLYTITIDSQVYVEASDAKYWK